MLWLRTDRGINIRGNVWDIQPNIAPNSIDTGDVVLLKEGRGHVAEIIGFKGKEVTEEGTMPESMTIIENWNGRVRTRDMSLHDPRIRGYWRDLSTHL